MTRDDVIDILTLAASYDKRTVGHADVAAWEAAIGDLPAEDSKLAVIGHYGESREWIMPADVRHGVRAIRADRMRNKEIPPPPAELLDDHAAYSRALRESAVALASGEAGSAQRAIGGAS